MPFNQPDSIAMKLSADNLIFLILAFIVLIRLPGLSPSSPLPPQLVSLLSLKSSLRDPLSTLRGWNLSESDPQRTDFCSWTGIQCNPGTVQIASLDLSRRNLSGTIPPEIRHLTGLRDLNLSGNAFEGSFPHHIFELAELRTLDISHNLFNSTFPAGVSKLIFLRVFNAYSNSFTGPLPEEFVRLRFLEQFNIGGSYFEGPIPSSYGGFRRLRYLDLAGNALNGSVPTELGKLTTLERLEIGYNKFSGGIPTELSFLSNLKYLDMSEAQLSGTLKPELGNLTMLESLLLFGNNFSGQVPATFGKMASIRALDLSNNSLSGGIPGELHLMKNLTVLNLMVNGLTGDIPQEIGDLPNLETFNLWNNLLTGALPKKLGSNGKLIRVDVSSNSLSGPIPQNLCFGKKLEKLILFCNEFESSLPASLANCTSLFRVRIQDNKLNGSIPRGFGLLPNLTYVDMSRNRFTGSIPRDLGNAGKLQYLNISGNPLRSRLPENIWKAPNLNIFSAYSCELVGKIPDFSSCGDLYKIELGMNNLSGNIPWDVSGCSKLIALDFRLNSLSGIIPWEISTLPAITDVDLSHNLLTGTISPNFEKCSTLESFNVSYNFLTGPIPSSGSVLRNLHPSSFAGNEGLCGGILKKPCSTERSERRDETRSEPKRTAGAIIWIMAAALGIGLFVLIGGRCFQSYQWRTMARGGEDHQDAGPWKLTAFQRLSFTAEEVVECVEVSNKVVGMGSAGTVYKAEMPGGETIAVKKLCGGKQRGKRRGAVAEVEVLGNVRHRNIVRLLGCCSNRSCTMLLYEYMPGGSLEDLLHGGGKGENSAADWLTRYRIALGVAQGICYLHHDCDPVVVHRDLKPSNILVDAHMEARVADFGVAKLIHAHESMSVIAGSYGYIAPEYAYTLQVDEKSDIYSYGVVLMEVLSGRRAVEAEFGEGNSIVDWIRSKIKTKSGINDVLDRNAGASSDWVREEMLMLLRVALLCTSRNPADRPSMRDVVFMLHEAKPKRKLPSTDGAVIDVACEADDASLHKAGA